MTGPLIESDRALAIQVLRSRLDARQLRAAIDRDVERLVVTTERTKGLYRSTVTEVELPEFLVDSRGIELLEGSSEGRDLRRALAHTLDDTAVDRLYNFQPAGGRAWSRAAKIRAIAERNWHPGKGWARMFVDAVGLPAVFAGVAGIPEGQVIEEVEPFVPLPDLHDYQQDLKGRLLDVLHGRSGAGRGLMSLPTGAGKTRTAVDALTEWWAAGELDRGFILWIAQSEELCEQAVQAFRETWINRGWRLHERRTLKVHRLWGGRDLPECPGGVVVASIQQLDSSMRSELEENQNAFASLVETTKAIVVDEAHHITAREYLEVLSRFGLAFRQQEELGVSLIGLTATPYRGSSVRENERLAQYFNRNLLIPSGMPDPIEELRTRGVLSNVKHVALDTKRRFELKSGEEEQFERFNRLPESFVKRVGEDAERNKLILDQLLSLDNNTPTLFFGCSIEHAMATAVLLRKNGRSAEAVSARTRRGTRRFLIEQFREGQLQVLCNYGVLTTGFDAPKVKAVVIARPTTSPVLYEQMIGRGMRGPVNGGTPDCLVVDLVDNIARFHGQMAYMRFAEYWTRS